MTSVTGKVGKHHGSAAINDSGSIANVSAMAAAAAAGLHEPAESVQIQAMYLSDSEEFADSPLLTQRFRTPPRKRPAALFRSRDGAVRSPGRQRKRVEASRAKHRKVEVPLEQSHQKAIEALTKQVRVDEEYMKDLGRIVDNLVLGQRRSDKWHTENTSRILDVEGRVNKEFKEAKAYINDKFKEATTKIEVQESHLSALAAAIEEQRESLEQHQSYLRKMHDMKPEEEKTLFGLFKTLEEELLKINIAKADQVHVQAAYHETKSMMKELNHDLRQDYGNMAEALTQKIEEIARGLAHTTAQLESNFPSVPDLPEGYERATRWKSQPQRSAYDYTCGNGCDGKGHGDKTAQWK